MVDPPKQCLKASLVFTRLANLMGLIPKIPYKLYDMAYGDRLTFGWKLREYAGNVPDAMSKMQFVLARTHASPLLPLYTLDISPCPRL